MEKYFQKNLQQKVQTKTSQINSSKEKKKISYVLDDLKFS